jgi:hypothetical protein
MKNRGRFDESIVCPFYKFADEYHIGCEGVLGGTSLSINFGNPHDKEEYKNKYCRDICGYHNCRVCEMLEDKYDDGK